MALFRASAESGYVQFGVLHQESFIGASQQADFAPVAWLVSKRRGEPNDEIKWEL